MNIRTLYILKNRLQVESYIRRFISSNHSRYGRRNFNHRASEDSTSDRRLRNVGIVAHINAGKTTTTERILYYSGSTKAIGDVDTGNTVTDYLIQERDRGITITSAAVSYNWKKHRINLIDTPGHVDFTIEVERSLAVIDGMVTILDASAGVEAQTVTVLNQAAKYQIPNVIFLNKYDKPQADYKMCINDLRRNLSVNALPIQLPIKMNSTEGSFVDVVERKVISWLDPAKNKGSEFKVEPLESAKIGDKRKFIENAEEERERLINFLSDIDDELASQVMECDTISQVASDSIRAATRRATIACQMCPILLGSSFRYMGVQQLMDAMVSYLPSPEEREIQVRRLFESKLKVVEDCPSPKNCAFIFKVMHDSRLGALTYLRVLSGSLGSSQKFEILTDKRQEQVKRVYRVFADDLQELGEPAQKDDIVVASGLYGSRTGDVLVDQSYHEFEQLPAAEDQPFILLGHQHILVPQISRMEPVYFCSIEAPSLSLQTKLESALANLAREDPSFAYDADNETGTTIIRGMGKLHLEVIRDRIQSEYKINSTLGPLQISYLETIGGSATEELTVSRLINGHKNLVSLSIRLKSKANAGRWAPKMLRLNPSPEGDKPLDRIRRDHRKAIEQGLESALNNGPLLGCPVVYCDIMLMELNANGRCGLPVISSAASQCLTNAIKRCSPLLLEPIMLLELVAPDETNGQLLGDLAQRRAQIISTTARGNGMIAIRAHTPLVNLANYAEHLRVATSGRATFTMQLASYGAMSEADRLNVIRQ